MFFSKKYKVLNIYTDGACWNNGKENAKAGSAFYCIETDTEGTGNGHFNKKSTNNTAELKAIFFALCHAKGKTKYVRIYSDSQYAIKSLSEWMIKPKNKNFNQLKNIKQFMNEYFDKVEFEWIKGHNISDLNKRVDKLAGEYLALN